MNKHRAILLLLAATALVYANALLNDFTQDDSLYIVNSSQVVHSPWKQLVQAHVNSNVYRPVTFLSYSLNYFAGGMHPVGFHLVNILLHCGVTLLLYQLLLGLIGTPRVALVAAWLFALHPIHTEAVTSAVGRAELLAAGFMLAGWLLHLHDREMAALACFALAMLSKESAIAFVLLAPAGDFALYRWKAPWRYVKLAVLAAVLLAWQWQVQGHRFGQANIWVLDNPLASLPAPARILNAANVAWKYVGLQIFPSALSCDYSFNAIPISNSWIPVLAALVVIGTWIAAWRVKGVFLAGAIYFAGFVTTSNILFPAGTIMGERLAYLPSVGLCLLAALGWEQLAVRQRGLSLAILALACGLLAFRTVARNFEWRDNLTLYRAAERVVPESASIHTALGNLYLEHRQYELARREFDAAIRIFPYDPDLLASLGVLEFSEGRPDRGVDLLGRALAATARNDPNYESIAINYAEALLRMNRPAAALIVVNQALVGSPNPARLLAKRAEIAARMERRE